MRIDDFLLDYKEAADDLRKEREEFERQQKRAELRAKANRRGRRYG